MDAPRGLSPHDADDALRDLFQQRGYLAAPDDLETRVLQRLAVRPTSVISEEAPLLPAWAWGALVAMFGLVALYPTHAGTSIALGSRWMFIGHLDSVFSSAWVLMTLTAGAVLLALASWLDQQRLRMERA